MYFHPVPMRDIVARAPSNGVLQVHSCTTAKIDTVGDTSNKEANNPSVLLEKFSIANSPVLPVNERGDCTENGGCEYECFS